jgi:hypothetical protein
VDGFLDFWIEGLYVYARCGKLFVIKVLSAAKIFLKKMRKIPPRELQEDTIVVKGSDEYEDVDYGWSVAKTGV